MSDFLKLVGENLRTVRIAKNLTQQYVAEKTGFSDSYVSDCERGRRNMSLETLEKFIVALEISPNELFNFKDIEIESGIDDRRALVEIHNSLLMNRHIEEIKYVHRIAKDFITTVDKLK